MRIIVTGSIASDHLMVFPGRFAEQLVLDKLDAISLSFLVDELEVRRGGAGANIAFNLGWLGLKPVLVGAVGADFGEYGAWLRAHDVDLESLHYSPKQHTARFLCTTDLDQNQIASFYAGAMSEAREISLQPVWQRLAGPSFVLIGPNDPAAMVRHTDECRAAGVAFGADPSQQLARMEGAEIRQLVDGAQFLFTNDYELGLLENKTGWAGAALAQRVETIVTTLGARGVSVRRRGEPELLVAAAPENQKADPTGVGDAFRAGYLAGVEWELGDERSAQLGCTLATLVLETVGTQEHPTDPSVLLGRLGEAYGDEAAADVAEHLLTTSAVSA